MERRSLPSANGSREGIDPQGAKRLREDLGDAEYEEILRDFLVRTAADLDELVAALRRRDAARVEATAHRIRPAILLFGGVSLAERLRALELAAARGEPLAGREEGLLEAWSSLRARLEGS